MANVALSLLLIKPKLFINFDTLCVGRRGAAKALKSRDHEIQKPPVRRDETLSIKDFNGMKSNPVKNGLFSKQLWPGTS